MYEDIAIEEFNPKRVDNQSPMTGIAIRNGSTIKIIKEAEAVDGTDLTGKIGKVYYILKDIKDEDGVTIDGTEVEESDSLDDIGIDVEFEDDCYMVPKGTYEVIEI